METKAYLDGYSDGLAWDLDGFKSRAEVKRTTDGWDEATLNEAGHMTCAKAWGVDPEDQQAWEAALADYNRGAHDGACSEDHFGLPPQSEDE